MIKEIKFKSDYNNCFEAKQKFQLKDITLLVGDQGCGKSSLLRILSSEAQGKSTMVVVKYEGEKISNFIYFDLENDNPRLNPKGNTFGNSQDLLYALTVKQQSHGEVLVPILNTIKEAKNALILLDEPETSLSPRNQFAMVEMFKEGLKKGNQFVIATHNILFMESFPDNLLSLEHGCYLSFEKFMEAQKQPSDFKEKREDAYIKKYKCKKGVGCVCANESGWYNTKCSHYINQRGTYHQGIV